MPSALERAVKARGKEEVLAAMSPAERERLLYCWRAVARESQLAPDGDWLTWALITGRGFGKTRAGAEWVREKVNSGQATRIALVGKTPADVRDVMIEGDSGILSVSPPDERPHYEPSKRKLTWPGGAVGLAFTSYEPDQLRGPQFDLAWIDELAAFEYSIETWDNLQLALRLGNHPQQVVTTTPRPIKVIRDLISNPTTVVTRGSSYENLANLAPSFRSQIINRYEGTRLGRQEIFGEIVDDVEGALWVRAMFDERRPAPELVRIVIGVDPAVSSNEDSNETGIIVCGKGVDGRGYVLADKSARLPPVADQYALHGWANRAVAAYHQYHADRIVAEVNQGGDLVQSVLRRVDGNAAIKLVRATKGKAVRAEPVAALYEQGRVTHCEEFSELEDQLCNWTADSGESPDRLDALVWAMTELFPSKGGLRVW
jgi:phage terminase large subunit-like protein